MKNKSFLYLFITFFMFIEIDTYAQSGPIAPICIDELGNSVIVAENTKDKAQKDSTQQRRKIIIIDKGQMDQLNIPPVPPVPDQFEMQKLLMGRSFGGNNDLSELKLMKSFKGESAETTKKFSVSPDYSSLNLNLYGRVKSGVISITLIKPNGSKFKSIEIDPTSDVSFTQGIDLKKDPKEWTGDWQIKIQAEKADGNYILTILTR